MITSMVGIASKVHLNEWLNIKTNNIQEHESVQAE